LVENGDVGFGITVFKNIGKMGSCPEKIEAAKVFRLPFDKPVHQSGGIELQKHNQAIGLFRILLHYRDILIPKGQGGFGGENFS
jgi:hypothetical protein